MTPRARRGLAWLAVGLLLVAGCTPSAACAAASVTLEVTVTVGAMDPSALSVCRDQDVTLQVHSQMDGEFHLHGYDEQVPETELVADETATIEFTADVAGQFIIEFHSPAGEEVEIGVLTVNEP
ncbi:MAG: hypothetical protein ACRDFR_05735 [Candidatus Limnocylindria bacterium]